MRSHLSEYPDVLEVNHIQQILRIGRRQAYEFIRTPPFKVIKEGRRTYVAKEVLIMWINGTIQD